MKKIIVILLIIGMVTPAEAAFWNRKNKALEKELQGKGYAGNLPNIESKIKGKEETNSAPLFEPKDTFGDKSDLKPVPSDNPAFINIIQKKDKTSQYTTDANEILPMLEKLVDCIEDEESVQLFVTKANLLALNIDNLTQKYKDKPEAYYSSFKKLQEVNRYIQTICELRKEALTYQRYLAYSSSGSIYNPENIAQQLEYLKDELNNAILLLREES